MNKQLLTMYLARIRAYAAYHRAAQLGADEEVLEKINADCIIVDELLVQTQENMDNVPECDVIFPVGECNAAAERAEWASFGETGLTTVEALGWL
jgi:hypothetical protein